MAPFFSPNERRSNAEVPAGLEVSYFHQCSEPAEQDVGLQDTMHEVCSGPQVLCPITDGEQQQVRRVGSDPGWSDRSEKIVVGLPPRCPFRKFPAGSNPYLPWTYGCRAVKLRLTRHANLCA